MNNFTGITKTVESELLKKWIQAAMRNVSLCENPEEFKLLIEQYSRRYIGMTNDRFLTSILGTTD